MPDERTVRRVARLAWTGASVLALAACMHAPVSGPAGRGGYYLDDGPGTGAAPDPASVPDPVPRAEELLPRTMRAYSVFGREYVPMTRLAPYRERGVASWYGRRYHGQPTSSGERYDMYAMTAAHPTLPIPSYVRVTHTGNGRSVVVRVNDRGPFLHGRVIDLSYTAAAKLGFVAQGSAEVDIELITRFDAPPAAGAAAAPAPLAAPADADAPPRLELQAETVPNAPSTVVPTAASAPPIAAPAPAAAGIAPAATGTAPAATAPGFWLQLGAFGSLDNARSALGRLQRELEGIRAPLAIVQDGKLYKVQAGPWSRREQALDVAERIRAATGLRGFPTLR